MNKHTQFLRRVQQYSRAGAGCDISRLTVSDGNCNAPLMIAGFQHGNAETKPFTAEPGNFLRAVLAKMQIPPSFVMLTNIIKSPTFLKRSDIEKWVELFREEVQIINPRCVILCGMEAAGWLLNLRQGSLDQYRRLRIVKSDAIALSYFVTHSPYDIPQPPAGVNGQGLEFIQDLRAVFEADTNYFERIKIIRVES